MKRFVVGGLVAVGVLAAAGAARADFIVAPGVLGPFGGGNGNNFAPFGIGPLRNQRYQQVYAASEFAALGPQLITQITFRPFASPSSSAFSTTLSDVQINLSTTAAGPDGLSTTFALNVGADDTVVRSGPLPLSSANVDADGIPGGPRAFDIVIDLATPFLYDPAAGNLLLDVRNFGGGTTTGFDFQTALGDSVSRVGSTSSNPGGVTSPTAQFADSGGLVTRFTTQPVAAVPEPASFALLGLGGLALAGHRQRKAA